MGILRILRQRLVEELKGLDVSLVLLVKLSEELFSLKTSHRSGPYLVTSRFEEKRKEIEKQKEERRGEKTKSPGVHGNLSCRFRDARFCRQGLKAVNNCNCKGKM